MNREMKNRRWLITGASSGIGRELARLAAREGARLALVARSVEDLQSLESELRGQGADARAFPTDITSEEQRHNLFRQVKEHFGELDILVNNAGSGAWNHFVDGTEKLARDIMEVNFFAPAEMIRQAIPLLELGQQPAIVNIASMTGRRAMPSWPEYSASKHALVGLTEALRGEMVRFGIDVLLILPGLTRTPFWDRLLKKTGRANLHVEKVMAPGEVAAAVLHAIRKNRTETVVGWDAKWMLRLQKFFPSLLNRLLARRVKKLYASGP
ncbi:MAG: SDR family oxidoreductase [Gemmataceae bacterium]|nr:SDR family oxidoreductase [Gemmataceae bacterium]